MNINWSKVKRGLVIFVLMILMLEARVLKLSKRTT